ncbi:hypothetical protein J2X48_002901 [Bosea sp. BE271]|nr:hypothetical protein [Bosea robiniae]MDR6895869.1 hypothetical protein [Bosea sp. BE109]MDR7139265.1 hypothetical protein [Bosea sp. BE168]MDR7175965.1 hypothetical protein [Bosea sp. BE271]
MTVHGGRIRGQRGGEKACQWRCSADITMAPIGAIVISGKRDCLSHENELRTAAPPRRTSSPPQGISLASGACAGRRDGDSLGGFLTAEHKFRSSRLRGNGQTPSHYRPATAVGNSQPRRICSAKVRRGMHETAAATRAVETDAQVDQLVSTSMRIGAIGPSRPAGRRHSDLRTGNLLRHMGSSTRKPLGATRAPSIDISFSTGITFLTL